MGSIKHLIMKLKDFDISFIGLKQGNHELEYELNDSFFEHFGFNEFYNADLIIKAALTKGSTMMELVLLLILLISTLLVPSLVLIPVLMPYWTLLL